MQSSTSSNAPKRSFSFRDAFAALQYPNFQYWVRGQVAAMMGNWMQQTAQGILIFELTKSPAYLGYLSFAMGLPVWLFTLYAGVLSDRIERRKLMLITQSSMMLLSLILAALVFTGLVQPWHILVLAFLSGVGNAFDTPSRLSFVSEMVDKKHITNAVALNGVMFNGGAAIGPAIAGVTYSLFGAGWCFLITAISFLCIIASLLQMKLPPQEKVASQGKFWPQIAEAFAYLWQTKTVLTIVLIASITTLFGVSITNLFPAWAANVLGGDSAVAGWLQSARGLGSFTSVLMIMVFGSLFQRGKIISLMSLLFPITLILFTFSRWLALSLVLLYIIGVALIMITNLTQSMVQNLIPDRLRGRVMAIYSLNYFGLAPIGGLLLGATAEHWSEPTAVFASGALALLGMAAIWFLAPWLRKFV
jgi:MFS family permease